MKKQTKSTNTSHPTRGADRGVEWHGKERATGCLDIYCNDFSGKWSVMVQLIANIGVIQNCSINLDLLEWLDDFLAFLARFM